MARPPGNRLLITKSVDQVMREANSHALKRTLGPLNLVLLGIGTFLYREAFTFRTGSGMVICAAGLLLLLR